MEEEINLKDFENSFEELTDILNDLILPFALNESTHIFHGDDENRKSFEKSFQDFKIAYKQTVKYCKAFITCKKPISSRKSNQDSFIYGLDANIEVTVNNFKTMLSEEDLEKSKDAKEVEKNFFAYLLLVRAMNTAILQYNKRFPKYKLETLKNVPEPKYLESLEDFEIFFKNWLKDTQDI